MKTKICSKCKKEKEISNFSKSKEKFQSSCKLCKNSYNKQHKNKRREYNLLNKDKNKEYLINNKDKIIQYHNSRKELKKEYDKLYFKENKEKIKNKRKEYYLLNKENFLLNSKNRSRSLYNTDSLFKLKINIRCNIYNSFKRNGYKKQSKTQNILGCSFEEFKQYIESKFESWMGWENHGLYNGKLNYGWDIDHIIPISSAKNEEEIYKLNHYTNFQPLCSKINRDIKKNKYEK